MLKILRIFFTFVGIMLFLGSIVIDDWVSIWERCSYVLVSICILAICQPRAVLCCVGWVWTHITSLLQILQSRLNDKRITYETESENAQEQSAEKATMTNGYEGKLDSEPEALQFPVLQQKTGTPRVELVDNFANQTELDIIPYNGKAGMITQPENAASIERADLENLEIETNISDYQDASLENSNTSSDAEAENVTTNNSSDESQPDVFEDIRDPKIMAHYIVLDIETTGFSFQCDKIIEIAAIHYVFGEEAKRFHTLINPQMSIPKHITGLTGIRQTDVDDAPLLDDVADDFRAFIKGYPIVGHNIVQFDLPFLEAHLDLDKPPIVIDTLDMSRVVFPMLPSHKLTDLNFWFNLDSGVSHHADTDAAATNALMWACLYPDKHASNYRKAVRDGLPETKRKHKPKSQHRAEPVSISEIKPSQSRAIIPGPLCGKKIVFTGELSIARKDAMQMAVDSGALLRSGVSGKTDFLVVGRQDLSVVGSDGMSSKQEKAQEINASGKGRIKIIDESEFMSMVTYAPDSDTN